MNSVVIQFCPRHLNYIFVFVKPNAESKSEVCRGCRCKSYMVEGILYDVTLKAKDGEKMNFYKANIWVRPWLNKEELTEFRLAGDAISKLISFILNKNTVLYIIF